MKRQSYRRLLAAAPGSRKCSGVHHHPTGLSSGRQRRRQLSSARPIEEAKSASAASYSQGPIPWKTWGESVMQPSRRSAVADFGLENEAVDRGPHFTENKTSEDETGVRSERSATRLQGREVLGQPRLRESMEDAVRLRTMGEYSRAWEAESRCAQRQLELEEETLNEACGEYREMMDTMVRLGKGATLGPVHARLLAWYDPLVRAIAEERREVLAGTPAQDRRIYGPVLLLLKAEQLAVVTLHSTLGMTMKTGDDGIRYATLVTSVGQSVVAEIRVNRLKQHDADWRRQNNAEKAAAAAAVGENTRDDDTSSSERETKTSKVVAPPFDLKTLLRSPSPRVVNQRARRVLADTDGTEWPTATLAKLGSFLVGEVIRTALDEDGSPVFSHDILQLATRKTPGTASHRIGVVRASRSLLDAPWAAEVVERAAMPRYMPMVVPPAPWRGFDAGGYLKLRAVVMRTHGHLGQADAIKRAKMPQVYDGLDALGRVGWSINRDVYDLAAYAWDKEISMPDFPAFSDQDIPPAPPAPESVENARDAARQRHESGESSSDADADADADDAVVAEAKKAYGQWRRRAAKIKKRNTEQHSLRCDMVIKLGIAQRYKDEARFYFPYNLDFRGRAYPVPPNLNHLGSDICRGMLQFADAKPLGERGFFWLKVHLANLFGKSKQSLDERAEFFAENRAAVLDSADRPLDGDKFWLQADEPWQALAACKEIAKALQHPGGPELYPCAMPVHADGSCNGLQHYAALGRDHEGGKQVNLLPGARPRDVYAGVCELVVDRVARDARVHIPDIDDVVDAAAADAESTKSRRSRKRKKSAAAADKSSSSSSSSSRALEQHLEYAPPASGLGGDDSLEDEASMLYDDRDDDDDGGGDGDDDDEASAESAHASASASSLAKKRTHARIVDGMIDRKVVKQTVMTSVYGVTFVGARGQILRRLHDKVEALLEQPEANAERLAELAALGVVDLETGEVNDDKLYHCGCYVAHLTLDVLAELFASARDIMAWLAQCARLVALDGQPVSWITPLGLPVVQPYRRDAQHAVKTLAQIVVLVDQSEKLPVSTVRQKSAFPPNFIHSLDSTHMLMTALSMDRRGYTFTAVHDSYWTHAADVDEMNAVLRSCFLDLYSQPILESLLDSLSRRYPHITFPPVPARGTLDISKVLQAEYFFS